MESRYKIAVDDRIPALIPAHNSIDLLDHCFSIMEESKCTDLVYPIVIDDRSTEDVESFCEDHNYGYIRIDHEGSFNYSLNMNTAVDILNNLDYTTALFMNNDCYLHNKDFLQSFIYRHFSHSSSLSGIKLLYPPVEYSFKKNQNPKISDKVQFGDGIFVDNSLSKPDHVARYSEKDHYIVNQDRPSIGWITGALNLVNILDFIEAGMYNFSLASAFQDVLLSINLQKIGKKIFYFGENIFFYHDESTTRMDDWNKNGAETYRKYLSEIR